MLDAGVRPVGRHRPDPLHLGDRRRHVPVQDGAARGLPDRPRGLHPLPPLNLGIISTADINRKVIPGARASSKVDLVAVASRMQERADEYAREWEIPNAYGSYEALLEDPD